MSPNSSRREVLCLGASALAGGIAGLASQTADAQDRADVERAPDVQITSVKTFHLRHKLKRPSGASVSVPLPTTRESLLIKIETNVGDVGWGETEPIAGARGAVVDSLAPRLLGRNPLEHRKLWRELWGANFGNGLAVGGVETALNDVRGKILGLPVAELFGGRFRDRVPVYVSALNYVAEPEIEEEYPRRAAEMVRRGHKAIKMRLGRYSVAREARVVAAVRKVVGPDVKLLADGNGAYTQATALEMADVLRELRFEYFEEPLPQAAARYTGYETLRKKMPLPLAGGEALDSRAAGKTLIDRGCFDIIQPDVSLCGGLSEALFIGELAALSGLRCIPHCWGGDIVIAASAHLLSLLPEPHWGHPTDTPMLEIDQGENPWRNGLAKQPLQIENGMIAVPQTPGLGIEIDEAVVGRYAI
ncbi:MAG: mandelate racemase/muconate lactonizing enzyme family protein [Pirellulaceae bacterium]|nr:mandelate racemase/muconate lactonizing enzyme family protein [Pirellulaceae bacterium]MDP7017534.1 mandelate racemase/muconate lactonizing enzyme family protein [Pirellulaceae bacterium]